jgi:hypothetical protein
MVFSGVIVGLANDGTAWMRGVQQTSSVDHLGQGDGWVQLESLPDEEAVQPAAMAWVEAEIGTQKKKIPSWLERRSGHDSGSNDNMGSVCMAC